MAGLMITSLGGGDYAVKILDDEAWLQIQTLPPKVKASIAETDRGYVEVFSDWVGWLTDKDRDDEQN